MEDGGELTVCMPYVTSFDSLVIPFNAPERYQYWKGGISPADTLRELNRPDLIWKYQDLHGLAADTQRKRGNEAFQQ